MFRGDILLPSSSAPANNSSNGDKHLSPNNGNQHQQQYNNHQQVITPLPTLLYQPIPSDELLLSGNNTQWVNCMLEKQQVINILIYIYIYYIGFRIILYSSDDSSIESAIIL